MSRLKPLWVSFWRKDQGLGMIEMALLMPMFLMFTFAIIDFGNYMIVKNRVVNATNAIATAIENNPTMTTSAYNDLDSVLSKIIATNMGEMTNKAGTSIAIWSSKDVPENPRKTKIPGTEDKDANYQFTLRNLENPWLKDNDRSNDNNPYYVGVYVWRANPWLTPLPRLLKLNDVVDPNNIYGDAAYGRKGADAFVAVTLNNKNYTCPAGQTLRGITDGKADCGVYMPPYLCPEGEYLRGYQNGSPVCKENMPNIGVFGGMYNITILNICVTGNPFVPGNGCSCPSWAPNVADAGIIGLGATAYVMRYCYR